MYTINCIWFPYLSSYLLLISMVLLKCTRFPLVAHFINFIRLFYPQVLLMFISPTHFLCDLLSLVVPDYYSCKDTFSFASQIQNANLSGKFLVSYNVTSLFTYIPLPETIGIATNLIVNHNPNLNVTKKGLFLFATSQTYFLFNGKFCNQIDGVAMGSPLAPVFAKIFMGFHKSKW